MALERVGQGSIPAVISGPVDPAPGTTQPTQTNEPTESKEAPKKEPNRRLLAGGGLEGVSGRDIDTALAAATQRGADQRRQKLDDIRELLRGATPGQLQRILAETRHAEVRNLVNEFIALSANQGRVLGETVHPDAPLPTQLEIPRPTGQPDVRVDQRRVDRAPQAPATFRQNPDLPALANRVTEFIFGRGGGPDVLRSVFYGLSKGDQTRLERLIGEGILRGPPDRAAQPRQANMSPERAFEDMLQGRFSRLAGPTADAERRLFRALRNNADSRFNLGDQIFMAVKNLGNVERRDQLLARFERLDVREQRELAVAYRVRYAEEFPPRLTSELSRIQPPRDLTAFEAHIRLVEGEDPNQPQGTPRDADRAFTVWRASTPRSRSDLPYLFTALEDAADGQRFEEIRALYAQALGGPDMLAEVNGRARHAAESEGGNPDEWSARMSALAERRLDGYLAATARLYLGGELDADEMLRVVQRYYGEGRAVSNEQLRNASSDEIIARLRASDPRIDAAMATSADRDLSTIAEELHRTLLGSGIERGPAVSALLRRVPPDQREAFAAVYQRLHLVSLDDSIARAFTMRTTAQAGPLDRELPWRDRLRREAREGPYDIVDLLHAITANAADPQELAAAMERTPAERRPQVRALYDTRFGTGAFDRVVARLDARYQRVVRG